LKEKSKGYALFTTRKTAHLFWYWFLIFLEKQRENSYLGTLTMFLLRFCKVNESNGLNGFDHKINLPHHLSIHKDKISLNKLKLAWPLFARIRKMQQYQS